MHLCIYMFVCVSVCLCTSTHTHTFICSSSAGVQEKLEFFFSCLLAWSPCTRNSVSEHCLPLESSPSQQFSGQNPLCNKLFLKDPGSVSLLVSLSGQDTISPLHREYSVPVLMSWEGSTPCQFCQRCYGHKHSSLRSPCF